jgi:HEPN domain-containing protein
MGDPEHAKALLDLARIDFRALNGMQDSAVFDDSIFGFHAQQTVEKALKSWIAALGLEFPKSHDLN